MKRFISTKFFRMLQESSQKGIDLDIGVLKKNAWITQRNRTVKGDTGLIINMLHSKHISCSIVCLF